MLTLAMDTCEPRGSVALLRGSTLLASACHSGNSDYSAWLLPAVDSILDKASIKLNALQLLGVCTGPGSFTGLRVGLTTVKAWAEVFRLPVVGVSRLLAIAYALRSAAPFLAASYDAHRGQLFAALYRASAGTPQSIGDELVISPEEFVSLVDREARAESVTWLSLDPQLLCDSPTFQRRVASGDTSSRPTHELAPTIGLLAQQCAAEGRFSDPLTLDANYVRRSDAELFWKDRAADVP